MEPRYETSKLMDVIELVDRCKIQLPSFQRKYVWKEKDVDKLLNSIVKGQFIGNFLLWEVKEGEEKVHRGKMEGSRGDDVVPQFLALDGQQRMTSAQNVFYDRTKKIYYLDLKTLYHELVGKWLKDESSKDYFNEKIKSNKQYFKWVMQENGKEFSDYIVKRTRPKNSQGFINKLDDENLLLFHFFRTPQDLRENTMAYIGRQTDADYRYFLDIILPYYLTKLFDFEVGYNFFSSQSSLEDVCETFENLNSNGLKLNTFDVSVAKLMKDGISLGDEIDKIKEEKDNEPIYHILEKHPTYLLQLVAVMDNVKNVKKAAIPDNVNQENFKKYWPLANEYMKETIVMLSDKLGIDCKTKLSHLPIQSSVLVISYALWKAGFKNAKGLQKKQEMMNKVKKWFYIIALNGRYKNSTEGRIREDLQVLTEYLLQDIEPLYFKDEILLNRLMKRTDSRAMALLCLINANRPMDFKFNHVVGYEATNKCDAHHLFPKAAFEHLVGKDMIDTVYNFTYISEEANKDISKEKPSSYILDVKEHFGMNFVYEFEKHIIDESSLDYLYKNDFDAFIDARMERFKNIIIKEFGVKVSIESSDL